MDNSLNEYDAATVTVVESRREFFAFSVLSILSVVLLIVAAQNFFRKSDAFVVIAEKILPGTHQYLLLQDERCVGIVSSTLSNLAEGVELIFKGEVLAPFAGKVTTSIGLTFNGLSQLGSSEIELTTGSHSLIKGGSTGVKPIKAQFRIKDNEKVTFELPGPVRLSAQPDGSYQIAVPRRIFDLVSPEKLPGTNPTKKLIAVVEGVQAQCTPLVPFTIPPEIIQGLAYVNTR